MKNIYTNAFDAVEFDEQKKQETINKMLESKNATQFSAMSQKPVRRNFKSFLFSTRRGVAALTACVMFIVAISVGIPLGIYFIRNNKNDYYLRIQNAFAGAKIDNYENMLGLGFNKVSVVEQSKSRTTNNDANDNIALVNFDEEENESLTVFKKIIGGEKLEQFKDIPGVMTRFNMLPGGYTLIQYVDVKNNNPNRGSAHNNFDNSDVESDTFFKGSSYFGNSNKAQAFILDNKSGMIYSTAIALAGFLTEVGHNDVYINVTQGGALYCGLSHYTPRTNYMFDGYYAFYIDSYNNLVFNKIAGTASYEYDGLEYHYNGFDTNITVDSFNTFIYWEYHSQKELMIQRPNGETIFVPITFPDVTGEYGIKISNSDLAMYDYFISQENDIVYRALSLDKDLETHSWANPEYLDAGRTWQPALSVDGLLKSFIGEVLPYVGEGYTLKNGTIYQITYHSETFIVDGKILTHTLGGRDNALFYACDYENATEMVLNPVFLKECVWAIQYGKDLIIFVETPNYSTELYLVEHSGTDNIFTFTKLDKTTDDIIFGAMMYVR